MFYNLFTVSIWNFKLFNINRLCCFKSNFTHQSVCVAKVKFVLADGLLILEQHY